MKIDFRSDVFGTKTMKG